MRRVRCFKASFYILTNNIKEQNMPLMQAFLYAAITFLTVIANNEK